MFLRLFLFVFRSVEICLSQVAVNNAYPSLILTNGVIEQLSEDAGPLLQAGRAAHAPQALRAGKLPTDCAQEL
ncbi:hypothetical protein Y032_0698g1618 [Ancylostoma ceylanicum]|uniref:Uncharacterized protein n=1 Tax=Ancylostoma ceylanicum TaxID=53326 RepID=A0A016WGL0_9BILA|nr:hypothetical protein Y032_0698g1618 [Ancylostoma ceylanicum]